MPKWRMWIGVLAVFACGLAIGAVAGSLYERHAALMHIARIRADRGASIAQITLDRLTRDLELAPEQTAAIKPLLEKGFERAHQMFEEFRPQVDKVLEETAGQIKTGLKPEQAQRLAELGGWKALLPPRPGPDGPSPPPPGFGGPPPPPPGFGGPPPPPPGPGGPPPRF